MKPCVSILVFTVMLGGCKTSQSHLKSETTFDSSDRVDLLNYSRTYTKEEFEREFNKLMEGNKHHSYKCSLKSANRTVNTNRAEDVAKLLDETELISIYSYTGFAYSPVNKALRTVASIEESLKADAVAASDKKLSVGDRAELMQARAQAFAFIKNWTLVIKGAASGLNRLPRHQGQVIRGATLNQAVIENYCRRECNAQTSSEQCPIATEAAFMSTTFNNYLGSFKGNVKFVIDGKSGRKIDRLSLFPNEGEVLFPPGADFTVKSVKFSNGMTCKDLEQGKFSIITPQYATPIPFESDQDAPALRLAPVDELAGSDEDQENSDLSNFYKEDEDGCLIPTAGGTSSASPPTNDTVTGLDHTPIGISVLEEWKTSQTAMSLAGSEESSNINVEIHLIER